MMSDDDSMQNSMQQSGNTTNSNANTALLCGNNGLYGNSRCNAGEAGLFANNSNTNISRIGNIAEDDSTSSHINADPTTTTTTRRDNRRDEILTVATGRSNSDNNITSNNDVINSSDNNDKKNKSNWVLGILCICMVAVIWTGATVMKQYIMAELKFEHPLFLTVFCNACFCFQFVTQAVKLTCKAIFKCGKKNKENSSTNNNSFTNRGEQFCYSPENNNSSVTAETRILSMRNTGEEVVMPAPNNNTNNNSNHSLGTQHSPTSQQQEQSVVKNSRKLPSYVAALIIAPIWFCGQLTYNEGISVTSNTSSTVICTTSCVSTFILSIFL